MCLYLVLNYLFLGTSDMRQAKKARKLAYCEDEEEYDVQSKDDDDDHLPKGNVALG